MKEYTDENDDDDDDWVPRECVLLLLLLPLNVIGIGTCVRLAFIFNVHRDKVKLEKPQL